MTLRIRQERLSKGWTQEFVAQKIGTTLSTVQKIECGIRKPSYDVLVKLLDLFEYNDPRELFGAATPDEDPPGGNRADQGNTQNHDSMTGAPGQDQ